MSIESNYNTPITEDEEDWKLVKLFCRGDRIAFDRLVLKYQDLVVGMCTRLTASVQEGEDSAQDIFLKMYKSICQFRGEAKFTTWLYKVTVNTCNNKSKSFWKKLSKKSFSIDNQPEDEPKHDISDTSFYPQKDLERKRIGIAVKEAISKLSEKHRTLVVLRDLQGLSYEEITESTGLSEGTVKSRLSRARALLQEKLKGIRNE